MIIDAPTGPAFQRWHCRGTCQAHELSLHRIHWHASGAMQQKSYPFRRRYARSAPDGVLQWLPIRLQRLIKNHVFLTGWRRKTVFQSIRRYSSRMKTDILRREQVFRIGCGGTDGGTFPIHAGNGIHIDIHSSPQGKESVTAIKVDYMSPGSRPEQSQCGIRKGFTHG